MDVTDLKSLNAEVKKRMDSAIEHVRRELAGLRGGRASVTLLDPVQVEAYGSAGAAQPGGVALGSRTDDHRGAAVRSLAAQRPSSAASRRANLGLNPSSDGKVVRIPIPSLTDERRKELSRLVHKYAEEAATRCVRSGATPTSG